MSNNPENCVGHGEWNLSQQDSRTAGAGRIDLKVEDDVEYRVGTKVSIGSGSILQIYLPVTFMLCFTVITIN